MSEFILKIEELKLRRWQTELGDVSIDECIELAQQADGFVKDMDVYDPARHKFQRDSRMWWQYAWLLSSAAGSFRLNSPHVKFHSFLVAYPKKQPYLDDCIFRDWLRAKEETEITQEYGVYMPVYLRDDEVNSYALAMYHKQCEIEGRLVDAELLETTAETQD